MVLDEHPLTMAKICAPWPSRTGIRENRLKREVRKQLKESIASVLDTDTAIHKLLELGGGQTGGRRGGRLALRVPGGRLTGCAQGSTAHARFRRLVHLTI